MPSTGGSLRSPNARGPMDRTVVRPRGARIEHLRGRRERGSNTCGALRVTDRTLARRADRTLAPRSTPRGSNTCAAPNTRIEHIQRTPNAARIEHLRGRGARRSNTCTPLHAARIEHLRGTGPTDRTHPAHSQRRADRTLARSRGAPIEHLHPAPRRTDRTPARHRTHGSNTSGALPTPRIEHLRGGRASPIEHLHPCSTPNGSNTCAAPGPRIEHIQRTPNAADRTLARWQGAPIEHLHPARRRTDRTPARRRTHGSNTSSALRTPRIEPLRGDGAHRHPSGPREPADRTLAGRADRTLTRPGGVRIEHLHPAPRPRIEHLCGRRGLGSNRSGPLHATDRTLAPPPNTRIEHIRRRTIPWIETLRCRRTRGSTPFRPDPCRGSTPFAGAGRADRDPSDPLDPADRTLAGHADRTPTRPGRVRIEHLHPALRPRIEHLRGRRGLGSNRSGLLDVVDRTLAQSSETRIETLPARSTPRIDALHGRRPARIRGSSGGAAVSTERPAALRLPPSSTAPESRNTK